MPDAGTSDDNRGGYGGQQTVRMFIGDTGYGEVPAQITYVPQYNFNFSDFSTYIPEKSPLDEVLETFRSGKFAIGGYGIQIVDDTEKQKALLRAKTEEFGAGMNFLLPWVGAGGASSLAKGVKEGIGLAAKEASNVEAVVGRDIRRIAAEEVNATFPKNYEPPYASGTIATEFTTTSEKNFVRVHGPNNRERAWVMEKREIEGLTPEQIKDKFALPETPTLITDVKVPEGTRMRMGEAGRNEFGRGEGIQYELLDILDDPEVWQNTRRLGE